MTPAILARFTTAAVCLTAVGFIIVRTALNAWRYIEDAAERGLL